MLTLVGGQKEKIKERVKYRVYRDFLPSIKKIRQLYTKIHQVLRADNS